LRDAPQLGDVNSKSKKDVKEGRTTRVDIPVDKRNAAMTSELNCMEGKSSDGKCALQSESKHNQEKNKKLERVLKKTKSRVAGENFRRSISRKNSNPNDEQTQEVQGKNKRSVSRTRSSRPKKKRGKARSMKVFHVQN